MKVCLLCVREVDSVDGYEIMTETSPRCFV